MSTLRQWLRGAFLLLPSLACLVFGLKLFYWAASTNNPGYFPIGLALVFGGMTVVPESTDRSQFLALHFLGLVLVLAYVPALAFGCYMSPPKRWEPYIEASIQKLEEQISRAKEKEVGKDSMASSESSPQNQAS